MVAVTPEREKKIRACWNRVGSHALSCFVRSPYYRAELELMPVHTFHISNPPERTSVDILTFYHMVEDKPNTQGYRGWKIVCEGVILASGVERAF